MVLVALPGPSCQRDSGLQWGNFNFEDRSVLVQRSVVGGRVDDVKTEYSRDDVPLDASLAEVLLQWRHATVFPEMRIGFLPILTREAVPPGELAKVADQTGCEAGRVGRGDWVAHIPPYLSLLAR